MDEIDEKISLALDGALAKLRAATELRNTELYKSIASAPEVVEHLLLSGILEVMLADSGRVIE